MYAVGAEKLGSEDPATTAHAVDQRRGSWILPARRHRRGDRPVCGQRGGGEEWEGKIGWASMGNLVDSFSSVLWCEQCRRVVFWLAKTRHTHNNVARMCCEDAAPLV